MKITVLDGVTLNPGDLSWEEFSNLGELTVYDRTENNAKEIIDRIGDSQVILVNKVAITKEILAACKSLKYIGVTATGYNVIDLAACKKQGVTVTNVPAYGSSAVAQFTFALLLEITSKVSEYHSSVQAGDWEKAPDFTYFLSPLMELQNKRIGLIGYGKIAQQVAEIAHVFQMEVVYWNHRPKTPQAPWLRQVSLTELYETSDIVSLHVPLFPETKEMINEAALEKMKPGAILLNTSRGELLSETSVAKALAVGKLAACGVDVVNFEPIKADNPLLGAKNCWITPHIAWSPVETRQRLLGIALDNLTNYLAGKPQNVIS